MYTLLLQLLFYKNKGASTNELSRLADFAGVEGGGALWESVQKRKFVRKIFFLECV